MTKENTGPNTNFDKICSKYIESIYSGITATPSEMEY